ncbi:MAG: DUF2157 domain-containing protein [Opitutaceae bacterium]|nr:DUF2157 domain-containing protein [Opitutaceae bacterium]
MSKEHRWLAAEIDRWVADGVITPEQGAVLRARHPVPAESAAAGFSWGLIVFFALGAIVVGLGVVLLFAYNWAFIPKVGKLAIVFGAIVAAHGAGVYFRLKADWRSMLGEGLLVLGTMLFGAGIWLVAQIYNIDEHFPTGFLVWGLGALALAWAIPSIAQAIVATIVLTIWGAVEVLEFGQAVDWATLLMIGGLGTLVWRLRSAVLTAVVLAGLYVHILTNAAHWGGAGTAFVVAMALSTAMIALGTLVRGGSPMPRSAGAVMRFFGLTGFLFCAYVLSFGDVADDVLRSTLRMRESAALETAYRWTMCALALGAWVAVFGRNARAGRRLGETEQWFYPLGLIAVFGMTVAGFYEGEVLLAVIFNLVLLGVSGLWIVRGCREGRLRSVVLGSIILGLLVFARYFDLFDSLAARGLAFLLFGGALFAEGFFYRKMRQTGGETAGGVR